MSRILPTHPQSLPALIVSDSLRPAFAASSSSCTSPTQHQGIVSILLSTADLAKLDLSKLQLFSVQEQAKGLNFSLALPAFSAPAQVNSSLGIPVNDLDKQPPARSQLHEDIDQDDTFSFHTPFILSPAAADLPADMTFPVFKTKGVVDAERASAEHQMMTQAAVSPWTRRRKKAVSMDEYELTTELTNSEHRSSGKQGRGQADNEQRARTLNSKLRSRVPYLPALEVNEARRMDGSEQQVRLEKKAETLMKKHVERMLSRTLGEVHTPLTCAGQEARIDLKASPAAKFLLQVMPWELAPSPSTPVTTPAAIPFLWEDVPGKPKPRDLPSPFPSLPLPPRLAASHADESSAAPALAASPSLPHLPIEHVGKAPSSVYDGKTKFLSDVLHGGKSRLQRSNSHGAPCRHRRNMHSWHVLQSIFAHHPHKKQEEDAHRHDAMNSSSSSSSSTSYSSNSLSVQDSSSMSEKGSSPLNSHTEDAGTEAAAAVTSPPCSPVPEKKIFQLPPPYVATIVPSTSPYRNLGPTEEDYAKNRTSRRSLKYWTRVLFRKGRSQDHGNSYLLEGHSLQRQQDQGDGFQATKKRRSRHWRKPKTRRLRRRGSRVIVATYRAIKHALLLMRRTRDRKLLTNDSQAPYQNHQE